MVRKDCEAANLYLNHIMVLMPMLFLSYPCSYTLIQKCSGDTTLFSSRGMSSGSLCMCCSTAVNIKCAALCQHGELALDHKDSDDTGDL